MGVSTGIEDLEIGHKFAAYFVEFTDSVQEEERTEIKYTAEQLNEKIHPRGGLLTLDRVVFRGSRLGSLITRWGHRDTLKENIHYTVFMCGRIL